MIYEPATESLLVLFEQELARYGKYDANGVKNKKEKARTRANKLAERLINLGVNLPHVRLIDATDAQKKRESFR